MLPIEFAPADVARPMDAQTGWSIPVILGEWLKSDDQRTVKFAAHMLASYHNLGWLSPAGAEMREILGVSKATAHRLFKKFAEEVIEYESIC